MPAYKCNQSLFFDTSQLGRITKTHMSFRDLQECGVNPNNGISCTPRSFDRRTGAVRIAVQTLFNPPPVREHGAREAISETSHAAGNTRRTHTYFHLFSLVTLAAAHTVQLLWDASNSQHVVGYTVFRGANPGGPYTQINSTSDPNTSYAISWRAEVQASPPF